MFRAPRPSSSSSGRQRSEKCGPAARGESAFSRSVLMSEIAERTRDDDDDDDHNGLYATGLLSSPGALLPPTPFYPSLSVFKNASPGVFVRILSSSIRTGCVAEIRRARRLLSCSSFSPFFFFLFATNTIVALRYDKKKVLDDYFYFWNTSVKVQNFTLQLKNKNIIAILFTRFLEKRPIKVTSHLLTIILQYFWKSHVFNTTASCIVSWFIQWSRFIFHETVD